MTSCFFLSRRICRSCSDELPEVEPIDKSIMEKMYNDTVKKALVGDNIFKQTSPAEVNKFLRLMEKHKPFDYVIDGRNVVPTIERGEVSTCIIFTNKAS